MAPAASEAPFPTCVTFLGVGQVAEKWPNFPQLQQHGWKGRAAGRSRERVLRSLLQYRRMCPSWLHAQQAPLNSIGLDLPDDDDAFSSAPVAACARRARNSRVEKAF